MSNPLKQSLLVMSLTMLGFVMSACTTASSSPSTATSDNPMPSASTHAKANSTSPSSPSKVAADSINQLALDLYAKVSQTQNNLFFSPYSLSSALAMTYAGAKGDTETEMAKTLHFANQNVHSDFAKFNDGLKEANRGNYELQVANALWLQKGFLCTVEFVDTVQESYAAKLKPANFAESPESARNSINSWVQEQTANKIKELLLSGLLTQQTKLVLTNAIYFKGNWQSAFKENNTDNAPFTLLDGKTIEVPTMFQKGQFNYLDQSEAQILELPYGNQSKTNNTSGLSMRIILPQSKSKDGLAQVEKRLSTYLTADLQKDTVEIYLPKFKVETALQLKETLQALGMKAAFDSKTADFSGMNGKQEGKERLAISEVVHKAFVEVNEKGTEAAAATGVVITTRGMAPPATLFRADHPFIFMIKDNQTGAMLFLGRVLNPTK